MQMSDPILCSTSVTVNASEEARATVASYVSAYLCVLSAQRPAFTLVNGNTPSETKLLSFP